jgi:hypothetical protein
MTRSKLVVFLAFAMLCVVPLCPARPKPNAQPKGALSGKVLFVEDDRPVWRARIELRRKSGQVAEVTVTNRKGEFTFAGLPFGMYAVTVNMPNCAPIREEVYLGAYTEPLVLQVQRKKAAETLFAILQRPGIQTLNDGKTIS